MYTLRLSLWGRMCIGRANMKRVSERKVIVRGKQMECVREGSARFAIDKHLFKLRCAVATVVFPKVRRTKQIESDQFPRWVSGRTVEVSDLVDKKAGRKAFIKCHQKQAWKHR